MYRRWLIPFATTLLLWSLVGQLNHYLAPYGAYLFVSGLLVTFAALRLSLRNGLAATLLTALAVDALEPVPFGTHFVLFGLMHVVLFHLRTRFPREELIFGVVVALLANLGLAAWHSTIAPPELYPTSPPTLHGFPGITPELYELGLAQP